MPCVFLICGKICSGKTTYARELAKRKNAAFLSCDELTTACFCRELGEDFDMIAARAKRYLLKKAAELARLGCNVVLDWGFWLKEERIETENFFLSSGTECRWVFLPVSDEEWRRNLQSRNRQVVAGESGDYFVDEGLLQKAERLFQEPSAEELSRFADAKRLLEE